MKEADRKPGPHGAHSLERKRRSFMMNHIWKLEFISNLSKQRKSQRGFERREGDFYSNGSRIHNTIYHLYFSTIFKWTVQWQ